MTLSDGLFTAQERMLTCMRHHGAGEVHGAEAKAVSIPEGPPVSLLKVLPKWWRVTRLWFFSKLHVTTSSRQPQHAAFPDGPDAMRCMHASCR